MGIVNVVGPKNQRKKRPNVGKNLGEGRVMDVQSRRLVSIFLIVAVVPSFVALGSPLWVSDYLYWLLKDITEVGLSGSFFFAVSYDNPKFKIVAAAVLAWRVVSMTLNIIYPSANTVYGFLFVVTLLYFFMILRSMSIFKHGQTEPPENGVYYILSPVQTPWGIVKCFLWPWQYGYYETHACCVNGYLYRVKRGIFVKHLFGGKIINPKDCRYIPIKNAQPKAMQLELDMLIGKRCIYGYRDCRKLMVAGSPRSHLKNDK